MRYLDPKTDLTFKRVFGEHKDLMISFLNAMLPLEHGKDIVNLEYLEPELVPNSPTKKDSIVDVRCTDTVGRQFIVEMQMYWTNAFKKRALLNTCKAYSMQAEKGTVYSELKAVYTLSLVNDIAFPNSADFYHEFVPTDKNDTKNLIGDFEMIFVELPKFAPQTRNEKRMQVLWLRFLTEIKDQTTEIAPELLAEEHLAKAIDILEESAYTDRQLLAYDKYWDMVSREKTALEEKYSLGMKEGMKEGMKLGMEQGILSSARAFLANGVPRDIVQQTLNLTDSQMALL